MARKPTPQAEVPAKPTTARASAKAVKATAPAETAQQVLDALMVLAAAHRCSLELPAKADLVPGAIVQVRIMGPESAERLVAECRDHPLVRDVQLLAAYIALEIVVPAEAAKA